MVRSRNADAFEPSAALAVLDVIMDQRLALRLPSAADAWESAWIACVTGRPIWTTVAQQRFAQVLTELAGVVRSVPGQRIGIGRDVTMVAGGSMNLEASPGIEPGCKDLQSSA